jgi:hypothetical protein
MLHILIDANDTPQMEHVMGLSSLDKLVVLPATAARVFWTLWRSSSQNSATVFLESLEKRSQTEEQSLLAYRLVLKSIANGNPNDTDYRNMLQKLRIHERLVASLDWKDNEALRILVNVAFLEKGFMKAMSHISQAIRKNPSVPSHIMLGPTITSLLCSSDLVPHAVRLITLFPELDVGPNYKYYDAILDSVGFKEIGLFWEECRLQYSERGLKSRQRDIAIANGLLKLKCYTSELEIVQSNFKQMLETQTIDSTVRSFTCSAIKLSR